MDEPLSFDQRTQGTRLTPELRKWLLEQCDDEEVVAELRELREQGGLELCEFVQELEQIVHSDGRTTQL